MHYFYLARCSDDSLYAGTCVNLHERMAKHNDGTGAKYTRSRRPVTVVYHEEFRTLSEARSREANVKQWTKERKEKLVWGDHRKVPSAKASRSKEGIQEKKRSRTLGS